MIVRVDGNCLKADSMSYLSEDDASAEHGHDCCYVINSSVGEWAKCPVNPIINMPLMWEGEICDESPLTCVVPFWDYPKLTDVEGREVLKQVKGLSILLWDNSSWRYVVCHHSRVEHHWGHVRRGLLQWRPILKPMRNAAQASGQSGVETAYNAWCGCEGLQHSRHRNYSSKWGKA